VRNFTSSDECSINIIHILLYKNDSCGIIIIIIIIYGYRLGVTSERGGGGYITSVARGHITTTAAASEDVIDSTCVRIILYTYLRVPNTYNYTTVVNTDLDRFSGRRTECYAPVVLNTYLILYIVLHYLCTYRLYQTGRWDVSPL